MSNSEVSDFGRHTEVLPKIRAFYVNSVNPGLHFAKIISVFFILSTRGLLHLTGDAKLHFCFLGFSAKYLTQLHFLGQIQ